VNVPPRMNYSQPTAPQTFTPQQPGWNQKPQGAGPHGILGSQPPTGLIAKAPPPPRPPISGVMGQRFAIPQSFQVTVL